RNSATRSTSHVNPSAPAPATVPSVSRPTSAHTVKPTRSRRRSVRRRRDLCSMASAGAGVGGSERILELRPEREAVLRNLVLDVLRAPRVAVVLVEDIVEADAEAKVRNRARVVEVDVQEVHRPNGASRERVPRADDHHLRRAGDAPADREEHAEVAEVL